VSPLSTDRPRGAPAQFRLDKANGKLMGVCAGLSNYFGGDPTVWRLIFVLGTVFGVGSLVIVYLAIGLLAD
jgi:phage shock protein PspC (stress-responsive transcriptional regulator)